MSARAVEDARKSRECAARESAHAAALVAASEASASRPPWEAAGALLKRMVCMLEVITVSIHRRAVRGPGGLAFSEIET